MRQINYRITSISNETNQISYGSNTPVKGNSYFLNETKNSIYKSTCTIILVNKELEVYNPT